MQQRERKRLTSARELAETMSVHVGTVSRAAHRPVKTGKIAIRNREYVATNTR